MSAPQTCAYTVHDLDGNEQPCDQPATGWRWYQGHDHEDMLDVACDLHENEGGRRLQAAEAEAKSLAEHLGREILKVARVRAMVEGWFLDPALFDERAEVVEAIRVALAEADE